jgi:hypothetical protein
VLRTTVRVRAREALPCAGRRLVEERGIALVTALGVLFVLSLTLTSLIYYTGTNSRTSARERADQQARALAEAGINNALAVLSNADDPGQASLLPDGSNARPAIAKAYERGTARWSGVLVDDMNAGWYWTLTAVGTVKNPTGPSATEVRRTVTARVSLRSPESTALITPIWNWVYSGRTGNVCDMTIDQSVAVRAPLYVVGNLCMRSTATVISRGPLVVEGRLTLEQPANSVGTTVTPIDNAFVGNGCQYRNFALTLPCAYNNLTTNVWVREPWTTSPAIRPPAVEWDEWYLRASPGPRSSCATSTGTPPTFEVAGDTIRNNNVPGVFHLTPTGTSYSCITRLGQLSWDHTTKVLTVRGTVFVDGSARIENGLVNSYDAFSTLYFSGTVLIKNSKMCALLDVTGLECDYNGWNPNTRMLAIAADGTGGQVPAGTSIQVVSSSFQGALYATGTINTSTTSRTQGPMVANEVMIGQSNDVGFPYIEIVPSGMPGNPIPFPTLENPEIG